MKNKKILGIALANTILMSLPAAYAAEEYTPQEKAPFQVAVNVDTFTDLPQDHWAYSAVKLLVEELEVMDGQSNHQFKGNVMMTRYQLADVFYRVVKKLERTSGKDLNGLSTAADTSMTDLDPEHKLVVEAIVNDYGIMQPMPGHKFMGNEPITRYEIADELYHYFILIESQGTAPALARRDRANSLNDLPADHWATKAVKAIVDKYQIMDGYPDATFRGGAAFNTL